MNNENISAFAFQTGRLIEKLIIKETDNLNKENQMLQAKILGFRSKLISHPNFKITKEGNLLEFYDTHFDVRMG